MKLFILTAFLLSLLATNGRVSATACTTSTASTDCTKTGESGVCTNSLCVCDTSYMANSNNDCVRTGCTAASDCDATAFPVLAGTCNANSLCDCASTATLTGSVCEANPSSGGGSSTGGSSGGGSSGGSTTSTRGKGKACTANADCTGTGYSGTCTSKVCVCDKNYWATNNACEMTGKACNANADCTGDAYDGTCDADKRCKCAADYKRVEDKCDGAAAMTASVVLVAIAAIFSRFH